MVIVGGALEGIGFLLVVLKLILVQRREFGTPRWVTASREWIKAKWRKLLRRPVVHHAGRGGASAGGNVVTAGHKWMNMGPDVPDRLEALEHNLTVLKEWHRNWLSDLEANVKKVEREATNIRGELYRLDARVQEEGKEELRASMRWEAFGVLLFGVAAERIRSEKALLAISVPIGGEESC